MSDDDKRKEISLLKAETEILRANIKSLEKENEALKREKSKMVLNTFEMEKQIKKKLELELNEERILQNQKKMFKFNTTDRNFQIEIQPRFILEQSLNDRLSSYERRDFLHNLKFFRDYFFDDFFSIPEDRAFEIVSHYQKINQSMFMDAFGLFSCKKSIFFHFSKYVFEDNTFLNFKIEILENTQPQWIVELSGSLLKTFIAQNKKRMLRVVCNIADKDPFNLGSIFTKGDFDSMLADDSVVARKILKIIASQKIQGYINETNLHLIPAEYLKMYFVSDFIDLITVI